MSEFRFICPSCDAPLDCPEELNGVETECPVCHAAIVPTISNGDFSECSEAEELRRKSYERLEKMLKEQQECSEMEDWRRKILNNIKKIKIDSAQLGCILMVLFFLIPFGITSCIMSCSQMIANKRNSTQSTIDPSHKPTNNTNVNANLPSKKQVVSKSKELLFTAVSNKISYSDRTEIDNSFFVNSCIVDATSAVVHATFKLKGVENAYSVEFKMMNGELTPTQIYYDNGITPAFYWKK